MSDDVTQSFRKEEAAQAPGKFDQYTSSLFQSIKDYSSVYAASLKRFINTPHFLTIALSCTFATAFIVQTLAPLAPSHRPSISGITAAPSQESIQALDVGRNGAGPEPVAAAAQEQPSPETIPETYTEISGKLMPGDTLTTAFKRARVGDAIRLQIIRSFAGLLDFRDLRPHDTFSVILDDKGALFRCTYESGPLDIYTLKKAENGFEAAKLQVPLECRSVKIAGVVQSSLFAAFSEYSEDPKLIYAFADIFASKIDFNTETRNGDRFSLVFEKYYKKGEFVGYGRILVARYEQEDQTLDGYYFAADDSSAGSYFDLDGKELGASFIKSPVPVGRVSSGFTYRRKHPILKVVRPHLGVDLAAPTGTPIMAAADGKVKFIGRNGGFGKQVVLVHGGGYKTYYGHLSRFKKGLKPGARVKQKQIIGYVGATGLATGPHLDYRISHNGVFKNPFALKFRPKSVLAGNELERFKQASQALAQLMDSLDSPTVVQVRHVIVTPDTNLSFL